VPRTTRVATAPAPRLNVPTAKMTVVTILIFAVSMAQRFLHRDADPSGLSGWTQFLMQGHTVQQLQAQIIASSEYLQRRAGGNTNNFLATVISDTFSRPITQTDRSISGGDLASGRERREVAEKLFATTEYHQDLVERDYVRYLQRAADTGGLKASVAALNSGVSDEMLIAAIVGSAEYLDHLTKVELFPFVASKTLMAWPV
jgi:hypothetical protein